MKHILLADEDPDILLALQDHLESHGYKVTTATNGRDAADIAEQNNLSLVLICHQLMMDGLDKIQHIQKGKNKIPIIVMTSSIEDMPYKILLPWVHGWLCQPINHDELNLILVRHCTENQSG